MSEIRKAHPKDRTAIAQIWNRIIRETAITFTTEEKDPTTLDLTDMIVLEAETILGFATLAPFRTGPGYAHTSEITIYLAEGAEGKGHAKSLLDALIKGAEHRHSFIAGISGTSIRAQNFFRREGFTTVAHIPQAGRKFDAWHDLILMQRILD